MATFLDLFTEYCSLNCVCVKITQKYPKHFSFNIQYSNQFYFKPSFVLIEKCLVFFFLFKCNKFGWIFYYVIQ